MNTSIQTQNFISLCRGGNPNSIQQLLSFQSKKILDELYQMYNTTDKREIAIRLSGGI
jgi:hypothetical protein